MPDPNPAEAPLPPSDTHAWLGSKYRETRRYRLMPGIPPVVEVERAKG